MPKMSKTQQKRMLNDIFKKAGKLSQLGPMHSGKPPLTVSDLIAIDKIVQRGLKRVG